MKFIITSACALGIALAALGGASFANADAAMPSCASGDPVVWENTSTKVYHAQGDSYYGKTKNGKYACQSDADKAGFHLSKSKSKSGTAPASGTTASAAPDAIASPTGKKHHRKKGSTASPAPDAASSPDAMASPSGKHHRHKHGASASPSPAPAAT